MDYKKFLTELCDLGPRYADNEIKAAKLIESKLTAIGINFTVQSFKTTVPVCTSVELMADGEAIPCQSSSMVSGVIPDAQYVISHFGFVGAETPYNIAYNPLSISPSSSDHYDVPSITVAASSLSKILMAKQVRGQVQVKKSIVDSENILVGNIDNPQNIIFAHYDSIIGRGAMDNAGSVVMMMQFVEQNPHLLTHNLFVFAGNEELSYDKFCKSYYGFRVFENKYKKQLFAANKIIVIDGIGIDPPLYSQEWLDWVFYIKNFDALKNNIFWLQTDQEKAFKYGHTHDDIEALINWNYLTDASQLLLDTIK